MAPRALASASSCLSSPRRPRQKPTHKDIQHAPQGTLTLLRRVGLCAGLMSCEAMGVISSLTLIPLLQTLGTPVSIVTVPGVVSASLGLLMVPILGCVADGGPRPHRRKRIQVVLAFAIASTGLGLNLAAVTLHILDGTSAAPALSELFGTTASSWENRENKNLSHASSRSLDSSPVVTLSSERTLHYGGTDRRVEAADDYEQATAVELLQSAVTVPAAQNVSGLPPAAMLSMAGFVLIDVGFDVSNSAVKAFMLTYSAPADHVPLLVTGVFVAAVGGSVASLSGMVNLSALLPSVDPVCSQILVQLVCVLVLSTLCCTCTLLSARTSSPNNDPITTSAVPQNPSVDNMEGGVSNTGMAMDLDVSTESVITATTAVLQEKDLEDPEDPVMPASLPACVDEGLSHSTQIEHSFAGLSISTRLAEIPALEEAKDTTRLLQGSHRYDAIPEDAVEETRTTGNVTGVWKLKFFVIWLLAFFSSFCFSTFSMTISDFLGKVVFGGDPKAEVDSVARALYERGLHTGSVCYLVLNLVYVLWSLCHRKVLALLGPKLEYLLISLVGSAAMLAMSLTGNIVVTFVTSAVMGLSRAALYTVPFVLANQLFQSRAESVTCNKDKARGQSHFGSSMALVTCALPSAYLAASSVAGPLMDATGQPSTQVMIGGVCSGMAAVTVLCIKS